MNYSHLLVLFALKEDNWRRRLPTGKQILRKLSAIIPVALVFLSSVSAAPADVTWSVLFDQTITTTYSLRGVALSADNSKVYGTWLATGVNKLIVEYNATTGAVLNSSTIPYTGSSAQAKSIATDDRGYVYLGSGDGSGAFLPTQIQIRSSDLQTTYAAVSTTDAATKDKRIGGASVWKNGDQYYLYITRESGFGSGYIQRFNVTDRAQPVLDTGFGTGGTFDLQSLFPGDLFVGFLRGLVVATDGTIYVASTQTDTTANKANSRVYKIAADLGSAIYTNVRGAMDVTILGSKLYVSQYDAQNSAVAVLNASNLSLVRTLITGFNHSNTSADSGYSGIDITRDGRIFVADQVYNTSFTNRLLVSSPVYFGKTVPAINSLLLDD